MNRFYSTQRLAHSLGEFEQEIALYLTGNLTAERRKAFEEIMAENPALAAQVSTWKEEANRTDLTAFRTSLQRQRQQAAAPTNASPVRLGTLSEKMNEILETVLIPAPWLSLRLALGATGLDEETPLMGSVGEEVGREPLGNVHLRELPDKSVRIIITAPAAFIGKSLQLDTMPPVVIELEESDDEACGMGSVSKEVRLQIPADGNISLRCL